MKKLFEAITPQRIMRQMASRVFFHARGEEILGSFHTGLEFLLHFLVKQKVETLVDSA